jgi:ribosomal protein S18 acetylase RimI-like enzyme
MEEPLAVRPATVTDMAAILTLLDEASAWLRTKDTDQWAQPWPSLSARNRRIFNGLCAGRTWLVVDDRNAAVATVTSRRYGNHKLWSREELREPAVYLSRLIVARRHAGMGIGEALIDWAGERAQRYWNAQWVRIDVWTSNIALRNYYEKRGFRYYGELRFRADTPDEERYPSGALYQKPAAAIDHAAAARFRELAPLAKTRRTSQRQTGSAHESSARDLVTATAKSS